MRTKKAIKGRIKSLEKTISVMDDGNLATAEHKGKVKALKWVLAGDD